MRWSDIDFTPPERTLRQFAGLWLAFFGVMAVVQAFWRDRPWLGAILALLAVVIGTIGLIRPVSIRPIFVGWMVLAFPIGWTVSLLLLGLVYYVVFTPVALAFRLLGRDALALRSDPKAASYWQAHTAPTDVRRYFRQF
jgi:Saxitoxin biosynthesis operon protein SxtJ